MNIVSDIQTILTGLNLDHIPTQDEVIQHFGSSVWTAAGAPNDTPRMNVGITDGLITSWFLTSGNIRGWTGRRKLFFNAANYLRLNNPAAGGAQNLSFDGDIVRGSATRVVSGVVSLATTLTTIIQPPLGQTWVLTDFASDQWVGAPPLGLPDITVEIGDGVNWAIVANGANSRLWFTEDIALIIDNALYARITNNNALTAIVGWSGIIARQYPTAQRLAQSNVAVVGIGGAINIMPTDANEEWIITGIYSSALAGAAPNQFPAINIQDNDGALASLKARATDAAFWLHPCHIPVTTTNYVTVTDTSGAGATLGYSAIVGNMMQ